MPKITPKVTKKFRELLLYVAEKSADDPRFGAVKLNKILYYSDFGAYRILGHSISGDDYQHLEEGPAPVHLLTARKELIEDGDAKLVTRSYFARPQQVLVAERRANTQTLTSEELDIVDQVIEALLEYDGRQVSDLSHQEFGWKTTNEREVIPYFTAWISSEPLTPEQVDKGLEVAERHGIATSPR